LTPNKIIGGSRAPWSLRL